LILLGLSISMISCRPEESHGSGSATRDSTTVAVATRDTAWIMEFRDLRDALYRGDKKRVKRYFTFPVKTLGNGIWMQVSPEGQMLADPTQPEKIIPFTEHDFDRYYPALFSPEFVKGMLKVKTAQFEASKVFATDISSNDSISYSLLCNIDSANSELSILLVVQFGHKLKEGTEDDDSSESTVGYIFEIIDGRHLRFKDVQLAG